MEPRLAKHHATPARVGNHFSRQDQAARVERILQAMLTNARAAGRAMARYAIFLKRRGLVYVRDQDIVEMISEPNSAWMRQKWQAGCVHPELRGIARNYMLKVLREKGWRL